MKLDKVHTERSFQDPGLESNVFDQDGKLTRRRSKMPVISRLCMRLITLQESEERTVERTFEGEDFSSYRLSAQFHARLQFPQIPSLNPARNDYRPGCISQLKTMAFDNMLLYYFTRNSAKRDNPLWGAAWSLCIIYCNIFSPTILISFCQ